MAINDLLITGGVFLGIAIFIYVKLKERNHPITQWIEKALKDRKKDNTKNIKMTETIESKWF